MPDRPSNVAASVRARLLNEAQKTGQVFDVILTRYVLERLLYRLSRSQHARQFVLKGAMLLTTWISNRTRGTRDLDLLGFGSSDGERMVSIFRELMRMEEDDGIVFDPDGLGASPIREDLEYGGLRLRGIAKLDGATIRLTIDIGFGDAVEPGIEDIDFPTLLDLPDPKLRAYPPETVIAEKFQAMIALGRANSRMKDFYDIWILYRTFQFEEARLACAIASTFERRKTVIPTELPDALTEDFANDQNKERQWSAFAGDIDDAPASLSRIVSEIRGFLMDAATAALRNPI